MCITLMLFVHLDMQEVDPLFNLEKFDVDASAESVDGVLIDNILTQGAHYCCCFY